MAKSELIVATGVAINKLLAITIVHNGYHWSLGFGYGAGLNLKIKT